MNQLKDDFRAKLKNQSIGLIRTGELKHAH